ncbi:DUF6328 family protein [uncultured Jatrophihabitans sp.]|uniref:DUF6328 family protein n=1 Tax=uncultured Jatrophihabitans sp. TaxID=1610747 RepID=UPI0035C9B152
MPGDSNNLDDDTLDPADADRHETRTEQLDRNWNELLQELRVIQTGVQLLTGFLLTLPFQQRFSVLTHTERAIYLATAATSIAATAFLQAPVMVHRALFRRHRRAAAVTLSHRLAMTGMGLLGLAIIGVSFLLTSVLLGSATAAGAAAGVALLLVLLWLVLPEYARHKGRHPQS